MSEKPPIPVEEFDYRDKEQFRQMYEWANSCTELSRRLLEGGRTTAPSTLHTWRVRHGLPIAQESYRRRGEIAEIVKADKVAGDDFAEQVRCYIRGKEATVDEIADHFDCSPMRVRNALVFLEESATLLRANNSGAITLASQLLPIPEPVPIDFRKYKEIEMVFGLTADNHIGSKSERMDVLECLFDRFVDAGVTHVYQAGNIIEGRTSFNQYEIYVHSVEEQVANLIEKWPRREGIITHFVTGDDHEGWWIQREGLDIGRRIEQDAYAAGRDDLRHLGYMERDLQFEQDGGSSVIRVIHAGGGSAYATSYTSQKYAESLQGGEKPQIVIVGHFHKWNWDYPREIHVIQVGCTQDQTRFMRKKKLQAHVGGAILTVTQNELGIFTKVKAEWIPFYDKKFYAFKW